MMKRMRSGLTAVCMAALLLTGCQSQAAAAQTAPPTAPQAEHVRMKAESKRYLSSGVQAWQYLDEDQEAAISLTGQEWTMPGYDSRAWRSGYGPFGAKNGTAEALSESHPITTLLTQYTREGDNRPAYFFRTGFIVEDPFAIQVLQGEIVYDDAVIVYLNGHPVYSENVPEGGYESNFSYGAAAGKGSPDSTVFTIPPELLVEGENVLAVELRQSEKSSSDIYFDLIRLESRPGEVRTVHVGPGSDGSSVSMNWTQTGRQVTGSIVQVSKLGSTEPPVHFEVLQVEPNEKGYSYRTQITGLEENCRYTYSISGGSQITGVFHTGNTSDGADLLLMGDPQLHLDDYVMYSQSFATVLSKAGNGQDLAVCFGDVASEAEDYPVYETFIEKLGVSLLPTAMLTGNHDVPTEHLSDFVYMPNMSAYGSSQRTGNMSGDYWFSYGGNLFLCLNSNESDFEQHRSFIQEAEKAYLSQYGEPGWRVVMMHHAIFSQGNNYDREEIRSMREALAPMFSELNIDVVFSGHDHTYSRSYLMEGTQILPYEGDSVTRQAGQVLYITLNSSTGAKYYDLSPRQDYTAFCQQKYTPMLTKVNFTPNRMYLYTWETESGEAADSFTLLK